MQPDFVNALIQEKLQHIAELQIELNSEKQARIMLEGIKVADG
jgi:hypothetical protein